MIDTPVPAGAAPVRRRQQGRQSTLLATQQGVLASATLYQMLATAFSNPGPELVRSVFRSCGELKIAVERRALPVRIAHALGAVDREWRAAKSEQLRDEYSRLFLGAGLVPLREGGFGDGLRFAGQPAGIADVSGFYLAFGFVLPASGANPPDHLGVELEFMSLLHLKLALALRRGRREQARITRSAMAHFLEDHLGRWAQPFEAALKDAAAPPAYRALGRLLSRTAEASCASLNVRPLRARAGSGLDPACGDELACPFSRQDSSGVPSCAKRLAAAAINPMHAE